MKATVKDRQTLADIALQYGGELAAIMEIATANGLSLTDTLSDGQVLEVPDWPEAAAVVSRYKVKNIEPATELSADELAACPYGGIGFMGIEIDFIVS